MPSEAAFLSLKIVYSSREFEPLIRLEVPLFESTILLKIRQILVPGRGIKPDRFSAQVQSLAQSHLRIAP